MKKLHVILLIVAILLTAGVTVWYLVLVPEFEQIGRDSLHDATKMQLNTLAQGLDATYVSDRVYPPTLEAVVAAGTLHAGYLKDAWGTRLDYRLVGDKGYTLCSAGPDRVFQTPDDLCKNRVPKTQAAATAGP